MAEGYSHGSEEVHELVCDPCQHDGQTIEAEGFCLNCHEFLCGTCSNYHTKQKPCRNHKVLGRDEMPKRKPDIKNEHAKTEYDECSKHVGKSLKYFCELHTDFGCSVCMTIGHRGCEDVQYIPEVAATITSSEEFLTFERKLRKLAEAVNENKKNVQKNIDEMKTCHMEINKDISQFREEINSYLDELETRIRQQADEQIKKIKHELDIKLPNFNQISLKVKSLETEIGNLVETGQSNRLYTKMKTSTTDLQILEEKIHKLEMETSVKALSFKRSFNSSELEKKIKTFGTLLGSAASAKYIRSVNVKSSADLKTCIVIGLVVMPDGRCVLADSANNNIKLLDKDLVKLMSVAQVEDSPKGICKISDKEVAITYARTIQYFSISDTINEGRRFNINDFSAITFNSSKEQLLTSNKTKLRIIDINGKTIEIMDQSKCVNAHSGICLTSDNSTLHVSHPGKDKITSLTSAGIEKASFTAKDLKTPRGIAVDYEGIIYVCGNRSNTIHVIRPGQVCPQMLLEKKDNLESPLSVAVSENDRQLLVGSENSDVIKLFQLY